MCLCKLAKSNNTHAFFAQYLNSENTVDVLKSFVSFMFEYKKLLNYKKLLHYLIVHFTFNIFT